MIGAVAVVAGEDFDAGARVAVVEGVARADADGALEAYGAGYAGALVMVGAPRPPRSDTPSHVFRVKREGAR